MGYIFGVHHTLLARLLHREAAEPGEGCVRKAAAQAGNDLGAVVIT